MPDTALQVLAAFKAQMVAAPLAILREVAAEMGEMVVRGTPLDTGLLRGNWRLSVGSPNSEEYGAGDLEGRASIERIKNALQDVKLGKVVFLTNPIFYGQFVEFGTINQEAQMFVAMTVAQFPQIFERAKLKILGRRGIPERIVA